MTFARPSLKFGIPRSLLLPRSSLSHFNNTTSTVLTSRTPSFSAAAVLVVSQSRVNQMPQWLELRSVHDINAISVAHTTHKFVLSTSSFHVGDLGCRLAAFPFHRIGAEPRAVFTAELSNLVTLTVALSALSARVSASVQKAFEVKEESERELEVEERE